MGKINVQSTVLASLLSIILGMLVGAVMMFAAGYDPIQAYQALFVSALVQPFDLAETIRAISPLIFTGLAVALAFRTGLFNIGVEGQFIIAQLVAVILALKLNLPPIVHAVVCILGGAIAGALWAFIPGFLKAVRGVHEVIITIMMNFIALYLSNAAIRLWLTAGSDSTDRIPETASIRMQFLSNLFGGARFHFGIFLALFMAFIMYFLLWKTKLGYELRAVGFNPHAAEYAGMSVKRNIILSMMISGAIAGMAGATELLGTSEYLSIQGSFPGYGFDGIAVALLGANTPIGVILSATLFGVLTYGGTNMQFEANVPFEVIRVVFAAIILFVASRFSDRLLSLFRSRKGENVNDR